MCLFLFCQFHLHIHAGTTIGVQNSPSKNLVLGKVLKSQKHIWWVLKSRLSGDFESQSQIFSSVAAWSHRLGFVIFYPVVQLIELSWWIKIVKQDKAAYWWASTRLHWCFQSFYLALQLNLSTTVTLGTEESSRCREVLNRIQSMDFLSARMKKGGRQ